MDEVARLLTLLAFAGGALTLLGAAVAWRLEEARRIRRTLAEGLGAPPQQMLMARGRGAGIGFDLQKGLVVVTWDTGGWRLTYRLDELVGVELVVDRHVAARAFRGETRRALDQLADPEERVRLRFVFDDAAHPDFELDLWRPEDANRRGRPTAGQALSEANRWMARMEALLRRPLARTPGEVAIRAQPPGRPPPLENEACEDDAEDAIG